MSLVFKDAPQVLSRTLAIAERWQPQVGKVSTPFPHFDVPDGYTLDSYFEHVTREGFGPSHGSAEVAPLPGKLEAQHL